ncbi:putative quorum-quenching lactonase YtnP [Planctomycetaceae bacterium]|nr:putative quorum-quenching lactonase YtnP [Planctomycetaceae bacterium]
MKLGSIEIFAVSDGEFRLDGGAMFGVVPRAIWEKTNPPDEKNRVTLGLNPLLVRTAEANILVDTGIGGKGDERFNKLYCVDRTRTLNGSLSKAGLRPEDIDIVICTHLHFDHAGGNTVIEGGKAVPAFPNARYIVQRGEWEAATSPNERTRASYRPVDFVPLMDAGVLELIEGDGEVAKGVSVFRTSGHNRDIQLVAVSSEGSTAVYLGDIIPTTSHLRLPYIMGYDLFPLDTLKAKKEILTEAAASKWLLVLEHDPSATMGYVKFIGDVPEFEKVE